ncbi:DUF2637 domain-containing protein [Kitasatospora sp. NPDC051170]|uniref:DUF2637 domain-containing protein n=1 Tax=Kitasatospora sp. NPDC051170 TaxID=3364056 RepID=UPI0037BD6124
MARPTLTKAHRALLGLVAAGATIISGIGFAGSYNAVRDLAEQKGFGSFSYAFPIGVDAGIVVLLALDLVLTWLRIPFPMLRQTAWLLTVATIAFNAAASWGDPLGMGMHAVIPVLFVVVVEASRHAVGRIAAITADRHMESVRVMRWILSPVPTFRLWRRMKLWELRSYDEVVRLEQNRLVYRAQLRFRYGRGWRRSAPIQALLPLKLAKYGVPLDPALLDRLDDEGRERAIEAAPAEVVETRVQPRVQAQVPQAQAELTAGEPAETEATEQAEQAHAAVAVAQAEAARQAPQPQPVPAPAAEQAQAQAQSPAQTQPAVPAPAPQPQPAAAAPAVPVEVAGSMLAKLAAARHRVAAEREGVPVAEEGPQPRHDVSDVWTARQPRAVEQPAPAPAPRSAGQGSPWFSASPAVEEPEPADVAEQFMEPQPQPQLQPQSQPQPQERPAPRRSSSSLDPDLAYEALLSYLDNHEGQQPDPSRLALWLTTEFGATGKGPDGSVHPKEVEEIVPTLTARYAAAGRD